MTNHKTFLLAAVVLMTNSIAGADLILTLNGNDLSDYPLISSMGQILVAVEGSTEIGPNDVSVVPHGGVLQPVPDANNEYYFEFDPNSNEATISLVTAIDMVIDGNSIPAATTIYQLWLCCNRQQNIFAAAGMGLEDLIWSEGESVSDPNSKDSNGSINTVDLDQTITNGAVTLDEPNELDKHPFYPIPYEPGYSAVSCPNDLGRPYPLEKFAYSPIIEKNHENLTFTYSGEGGYVELQEITSSQFLDPGVIYYVPNPPLLIHAVGAEQIDVVIPSDTFIVLAEDWDYGIVVYDGANVHFGEPTPQFDEPSVIYEPDDATNPVPPVWVVGESGRPFFNNFCGIFIERTAGTRCKLDNVCLSGFYYGIQVDQQLEQAISNTHISGCYNGILSFGPNRILNSSVSYYGIWLPDWPYDGRAYEFMSQSWDGTIFFEGADFEIFNSLADDGDYAFTANGLYEPYEEPILYAIDCAATNSYTGFNCVNGFLGISVVCPGLYNNYQDKNFPELPFTDPVYEVSDPFTTNPDDYRIFLNANSQFVDHASGPTAFQGWTTNINGVPDAGVGDIWPHYQTNRAEKYPNADLNFDDTVDFSDLSDLADQWLNADPVRGDYNNDQKVDFPDYSVLANQWLLSEVSIEILNLDTVESIDLNNIYGYVGIQISNIPPLTGIVSLYLDNVYVGNLSLGWDDEQRWIGLQSDAFTNGWHVIRLVSSDIYGNTINHRPINVRFNNLLYQVAGADYFHPSEDYKYSGFYDGGNTLEAQVTNQDGQIIWSNSYTAPYVSIVIPGATFGSHQFCELSIAETEGGEMPTGGESRASSSPGVTTKDLIKKFKKSDYEDVSVRMVIVLPNKDVFDVRKPVILDCARACQSRGVSWVSLYDKDVTEENLTFLYNKPSVRYIYWCGHANSHVGRNERAGIEGVKRTHTICWELEEGWVWDSWKERGVFSYTRQSVPDAEPLPDNWDTRGFDLWLLGMQEQGNKKIVFVDGCLSALYPGMASSYGMFSLWNAGHHDQCYIGWKIEVLVSEGILERIIGNTTEGVRMFWERMGYGDTIFNALYYTSSRGDSAVKQALWGDNGMLDIGGGLPEDIDDNIILWGEGLGNRLDP